MTPTDLHSAPRPLADALWGVLRRDLLALLTVAVWTACTLAWVAPRLARFGFWLNQGGPAQVAVIAALIVVAVGPPALVPIWHAITG